MQASAELQTSLQHAQQHETRANRLEEHVQRLQDDLQKVHVSNVNLVITAR